MGIYHDSGFPSTCDECGKDGLETAVTWKARSLHIGNMMSRHNLTLCADCAVYIGACLIGDAREASVAFYRPQIEHREDVANTSLVTRKVRDDDHDPILD